MLQAIDEELPTEPNGDQPRSAWRGAALLLAAVFVAELFATASVAVGILYTVAVLVSVWTRDQRATALSALVATGLTITSLFLAGDAAVPEGWLNRAVVVFAVWVTAGLGLARGGVEARLEDSRRAVERLAYKDSLTGLPNRNSFLDRLGLELAHARRDEEPLALLFLDLDGFKRVNDTRGHHVGDLLLVSVARRLRTNVREGDTVARLSGDEFTVILTRIGTLENARRVAEKLVEALEEPHVIEGSPIVAAPSIGIAMFPEEAADIEGLLRRSDAAMYRAKRSGWSRVFDGRTAGEEDVLVPREAAATASGDAPPEQRTARATARATMDAGREA